MAANDFKRNYRGTENFGKVFNAGTEFERDGSQFDRLLDDNDSYQLGQFSGRVIHTPGHTPACMAHIIEDAVLLGIHYLCLTVGRPR